MPLTDADILQATNIALIKHSHVIAIRNGGGDFTGWSIAADLINPMMDIDIFFNGAIILDDHIYNLEVL